jgi:hypothetical protein
MPDPYRGVRAALLTRHEKGAVVAPVLRSALGIAVVETDGFDTDQLGTFSGEVERELAPLECATRKATIACSLTGCDYGLGSEGTFGAGPLGAIFTWNTELLAWHDRQRGFTVIGRAEGPSSARRVDVDSVEAACRLTAGFPAGQAAIVRSARGIRKGLLGPDAVRAALEDWFGAALSEAVTIEYDLRAHHCPERRERIAAAARDLVRRLQSTCPVCARPDFVPDHGEPGLPCRDCGTATARILRRRARCRGCAYEREYPAEPAVADPFDCEYCNP